MNQKAGLVTSRSNVRELQFSHDKKILERVRAILQYKGAVQKMVGAREALLEAMMVQIEAESDVEGLKRRNEEVTQALARAETAVRQAAESYQTMFARGREMAIEARDVMDQNPGREEYYKDLGEGKDSNQLRLDMDAESAKLSLIHAVDSTVLRDFERRGKEIDDIRSTLAKSSKKLEKLNAEADKIRSKWEPELDELILKINDAFAHNFEQISCKGEIRVDKPEDFSQWALLILVSFR